MIFFLNSHLLLSRSLRLNENQWWIFKAKTSKFCNCSGKFGSSPRNGKVDLCTTNGSKDLIYLTLLNFLLHYLQEYSKIWNVSENMLNLLLLKSYCCNHLLDDNKTWNYIVNLFFHQHVLITLILIFQKFCWQTRNFS